VIERHGRSAAHLVRANAGAKLQLGAMKGEFSWQDGWERPLTSEESKESRW